MSATAITAVIFDMDGVLTDSEPLINEAAVSMFRELGHEVQPEDFLPFVGTGEDRYLGGVAEKYGIQLDVPSAKKRTYEIYLGLVPLKLQAFPGAADLVRACQQAGWRVAVASSADRIKIDANLDQIGLPSAGWDAVVSGEDVERKKPAPDIFLAAARRLDVVAEGCVVIEDAVNGVAAAKAAGMRCVAVAQTFPATVLSGADLIRSGMADVQLEDLVGRNPGQSSAGPPSLPEAGDGTNADAVADPARIEPVPWGFWSTLLLSFVIFVGFVLGQWVGMAMGARLSGRGLGISSAGEFTGSALAWATCAGAPIMVVLCWVFAAIRRGQGGRAALAYLGAIRVGRQTLLTSLLAMLVFWMISDGLTWMLGRQVIPEVMVRTYQSAGSSLFFWLAAVVFAPMGEETLFRGFMLPGMSRTRLGPAGAIVLTSLFWAWFHFQYDLYYKSIIFFAGLLLGGIRLRTGSLLPCVAMHAAVNFVSMVEMAIIASKR